MWCELCGTVAQQYHEGRHRAFIECPSCGSKITYYAYLASPHWELVKRRQAEFAKYRCQMDSIHSGPKNVHHRDYEHLWKESTADVIYLCRPCHAKFHDELVIKDDKVHRYAGAMLYGEMSRIIDHLIPTMSISGRERSVQDIVQSGKPGMTWDEKASLKDFMRFCVKTASSDKLEQNRAEARESMMWLMLDLFHIRAWKDPFGYYGESALKGYDDKAHTAFIVSGRAIALEGIPAHNCAVAINAERIRRRLDGEK